MPRLLLAVIILLLGTPVHAGVYNLAEFNPFIQLDETRGYLLRVRSASLPHKTPLNPELFKAQILRQVAVLEKQKAEGLLSTEDRINLSGAYLRLGGNRVADAVPLLLAADRDHFLVQSNLAAAFFSLGELEKAVSHQRRVLTLWPTVFAGWTEQRLRFFRECERYLLTLYESRLNEARRGPLRGAVDVDLLFPGLRFVGPSGQFEAGALAPAVQDRLPLNAFNIVYQLALWFPTDMRLYWLFGQMLNVEGAVDQACDVFVELAEAGLSGSFKDLPAHRQVLRAARSACVEFRKHTSRGMLLSQLMLMPRSTFALPVIGDAAYIASAATASVIARQSGNEGPGAEDFQPPGAVATPAQPVFNFRHIAIGFGFGFLVAALCAFQWQEWRRRRTQASPVGQETEPVVISPNERSTAIKQERSTSITQGG